MGEWALGVQLSGQDLGCLWGNSWVSERPRCLGIPGLLWGSVQPAPQGRGGAQARPDAWPCSLTASVSSSRKQILLLWRAAAGGRLESGPHSGAGTQPAQSPFQVLTWPGLEATEPGERSLGLGPCLSQHGQGSHGLPWMPRPQKT